MRRSLFVCGLVACVVLALSASPALAGENWIGSWKVNLAKSKYSPGPAPQKQDLKFEATPDGIKFSGDGVSADGKATHTEYVSKFDGKEAPYKGNPDADTASPKKIDDNSYENTWKKAGKVTIKTKAAVSADGKTLTVKLDGTNSKGEKVDNTAVYDRQ